MDGHTAYRCLSGLVLLFVTSVAIAELPVPLLSDPGVDPGLMADRQDGWEPGGRAVMERHVSLRDVRRIALEQNKALAVVRYLPEEQATEILAAEGRFDTLFGMGIFGGEIDRQNRSIVDSFGSLTNVQEEFFVRPLDQNEFFLQQCNLSGGITRLAYDTSYSTLDPAGLGTFVNPAWESRLLFRYEQPLLRDAGWQVNEAPIVIARRRTEQSTFQFEQEVHRLLRDTEDAYWDLELAHQLVLVFEDFEASARSTLVREQKRLELGTGTLPDVAQSEERYANAQSRVVSGEGLVNVAMLKLRQIAGVSSRDMEIYVPADDAALHRSYPDLPVAMERSLGRPEVLAQAAALRASQQMVLLACNGLEPDLRVIADYATTGLEETFARSMDTLADFQYHEWTVGVRYSRSINQCIERANVRKAKLVVSRTLAQLEQLEHDSMYEVAQAYERVQVTAATLRLQGVRIESAAREFEARQRLYEDGRGSLAILLESEDRLLAAKIDERVAYRDHQKAITDLKYASGTILEEDVIIEH